MALDTGLLARPILVIVLDSIPSARMRIPFIFSRVLVTSHADVPVRMAGLAGLQIPSSLGGMVSKERSLGTNPHKMGFDSHAAPRESAMAVVAVGRLMTAVAALGVIQGLDRVDAQEVRAVVLGDVVALEGTSGQVPLNAAAGVAVETPGLGVALGAVAARLARQNPVTTHPVAVMVRSDAFSLVTAGAVGKRSRRILLVGHLLGKGHLHKEGRHAQQQ